MGRSQQTKRKIAPNEHLNIATKRTLLDFDCFSLPSQIYQANIDPNEFFVDDRPSHPQFQFSYPLPLESELIHLSEEWKDVGTQTVREHLEYKNTVNFHRFCARDPRNKLFTNWSNTLDERIEAGKKANIYPKTLIKYMKILELDPDPYFRGNYNWYLTGGNVDVVKRGKSKYLVRAFGDNVENLEISELMPKSIEINQENIQRFNLGNNEPIFECRSYENSSFSSQILVRKRSNLSVMSWNENGEQEVLEHGSKIPFVTAEISLKSNCLAAVTADKKLKVTDLLTGKKVLKKRLDHIVAVPKDNWCCIRSYDGYSYLYADRDNLRVIDPRQKVLTSHFPQFHYYDVCEEISCIEKSKTFENVAYVSSTHRLFAVDLRNFSGELHESNLSLVWTHQMKMPPVMIKVQQMDDHEVVVLLSNFIDDVRSVSVLNCGTKLVSHSLPQHVPSFLNSYQLAIDSYSVSNPISSARKRLKLCTIGSAFVPIKKKQPYFITQNSACDMFYQSLGIDNKNSTEPSTVIDAVVGWERKVDKFSNTFKPFHHAVNADFNMTELVNAITPGKRFISKTKIQSDPPMKWYISVQELNEYQDALSGDMLRVWNIESTDPNQFNPDAADTEPVPFEDKVASWFARDDFDTSTQQEPTQDPIQDSTLFIDKIDVGDETQAEPITDLSLNASVVPIKRHEKKERKRHTMGF